MNPDLIAQYFNAECAAALAPLVTLAGGFSTLADTNFTIVTRGKDRIPIPVEKIMQGLAGNFALKSGDIIYVPETVL